MSNPGENQFSPIATLHNWIVVASNLFGGKVVAETLVN
jgi:hypothetical protein